VLSGVLLGFAPGSAIGVGRFGYGLVLPLMQADLGLTLAQAGLVGSANTGGYLLGGLRLQSLPQYSLGFVYLPALACLVAASMSTAPWGARLAHRLPVTALRRVFAVLLYVLATKMAISYWPS